MCGVGYRRGGGRWGGNHLFGQLAHSAFGAGMIGNALVGGGCSALVRLFEALQLAGNRERTSALPLDAPQRSIRFAQWLDSIEARVFLSAILYPEGMRGGEAQVGVLGSYERKTVLRNSKSDWNAPLW